MRSVAVSSDGEIIVSGSIDGTVQGWRASNGEAIGEPLRGDDRWISSATVTEDYKSIVS